MTHLDGVVLDLDDTLLDTSGLLIPVADRAAVSELQLEPAAAVAELARLRDAGSDDPLGTLAQNHDCSAAQLESARQAWLDYEVPPLELSGTVVEVLDALAVRLPLALLTQGVPRTQWSKIRRLSLEPRFVECVVVPPGVVGGKFPALRSLLQRHRWAPERVVVVGDRLASDVRAANACGCLAVHLRRGEGRLDRPANAADRPWRTIDDLRELPALVVAAVAKSRG